MVFPFLCWCLMPCAYPAHRVRLRFVAKLRLFYGQKRSADDLKICKKNMIIDAASESELKHGLLIAAGFGVTRAAQFNKVCRQFQTETLPPDPPLSH